MADGNQRTRDRQLDLEHRCLTIAEAYETGGHLVLYAEVAVDHGEAEVDGMLEDLRRRGLIEASLRSWLTAEGREALRAARLKHDNTEAT